MEVSWAHATAALLVALGLLALTLYGRRRQARWPVWEMALEAHASHRDAHAQLEAAMTDEFGGLEDTLRLARAQRERGDDDEALRVLRLAAQHVARYVPTLLDRLWIWWDVARAVAALYPLPRLRVWRFEGWKLRGVAAGEGLLRPLLGAGRRFFLRVRVLAYGFGVVLGGFHGTTRVLDRGQADVEQALRRMEALGADLGTLQAASLDVYKALLISITRETTAHSN